MASSADSVSMALFCDFENVALGVRDAKYDKFDIKRVLERLLLKGSIVVKKAYCDWDRYKSFKAAMHEANFELIEIPHVRQSGKNSADIRLVVDALDLCYTKSHVDTFVIISGDSDFSPLVSKLRENAKQVIGVGVKQSTSDLLIANCDEFIFYDDLVRDSQRSAAKREARENPAGGRRSAEEEKLGREELEARRAKAIDIAIETFDALLAERGDSGKIWASMLKEAIKRRKPDFNESYFGFRAFGNLLEEAQTRGLLELGKDEKSGTYVTRTLSAAAVTAPEPVRSAGGAQSAPASAVARPSEARNVEAMPAPAAPAVEPTASAADESANLQSKSRRGRGRSRAAASKPVPPTEASASGAEAATQATVPAAPSPQPAAVEHAGEHAGEPPSAAEKPRAKSTRGRRTSKPKADAETLAAQPAQTSPAPSGVDAAPAGEPERPVDKAAPAPAPARPRRTSARAPKPERPDPASGDASARDAAAEAAPKPAPAARRSRKPKAAPTE